MDVGTVIDRHIPVRAELVEAPSFTFAQGEGQPFDKLRANGDRIGEIIR
jgi:hypothetical protein